MVVKAKYLCSMQVDTNRYWNKQPTHHVITVPTRTILHPQPEVDAMIEFLLFSDSNVTSRSPLALGTTTRFSI